MDINLSELATFPIFKGLFPKEIENVLQCLLGVKKTYKKNAFVFFPDEKVNEIGIVISGSVSVIKEDFWGNRDIIDKTGAGGIFGEAVFFSNTKTFYPGVAANEDSEILFINMQKLSDCKMCDKTRFAILNNMLTIMADKTIMLNQKIEHIVKRSTKEKLLSYLSAQSAMVGKNEFDIPFNRQELADFLSVDRSAMSNELSKLRKEGIIKYDKNHFELKNKYNTGEGK